MSNPLHSYVSENGDRDLYSGATLFSQSNAGSVPRFIVLDIVIGDGTKNLNGTGETTLTFQVSNGGVAGSEIEVTVPASQTRFRIQTDALVWLNGETLALSCSSSNSSDTDVDCTVTARDVAPLQSATSGIALAVEDDGMAHADLKEWKGSAPADLVDTNKLPASVQHLPDGIITGAKIQDAALTAAKFASGAFDAVWSVASRTLTAFGFNVTVGTNNDKSGYSISGTIQTLDALDSAQDAQHATTQGKIDTAQADLDVITGPDGAILATSQDNYAPAKAGDEMNLVDAPNATAVSAIQNGLATSSDLSTLQGTANTILARLGGWTGTGINTVLGAFRAIWNKASGLTPTDLTSGVSAGEAGDNTTDSLVAIRDKLADADLTATRAESYGGDGENKSVVQQLCEIEAHLGRSANSGTNKTIYQRDNSTPAKTYTYDDADTPTSIMETT